MDRGLSGLQALWLKNVPTSPVYSSKVYGGRNQGLSNDIQECSETQHCASSALGDDLENSISVLLEQGGADAADFEQVCRA